jgi:hypothetical protein
VILTLENTVKNARRIRLFDAKGIEIRYPIEANTETGVVLQFSSDENGIMFVDGDHVRRETKTHLPPLQVVWVDQ